jgi:diaminopimelate decarboxylase
MLNNSIRYEQDVLTCDGIRLTDIAAQCGTPAYIYSLPRALHNYHRIKNAFAGLNAHVHYSTKANANLSILRTLIDAGAGIDAVSGGEIHRALTAGARPENIVFAGVGKTPEELRYAVEQGIGWFNVENVEECAMISAFVEQLGREPAWIALRLNPDVTANTHPYIATGHGGAKFGLTAEAIRHLLSRQQDYPHLRFAGIHVHIGSQLHDIDATKQAVQKALDLIVSYPNLRTFNIGGGLPVAYHQDDELPAVENFAQALTPLLKDYNVLLEPGRSIIADAGLLLTRVLYVKHQAGQTVVIVDSSMAELIRPALYKAHHDILAVQRNGGEMQTVNIVGPVCETSDVLGRDVVLSAVKSGDLLAITTAGAYGMVMASNYNARPRPPEIVIEPDGKSWRIARKRETWDDLIQKEL